MSRDFGVKRIIAQDHHRNGVGGNGGTVTLFEASGVTNDEADGPFVAITMDVGVYPADHANAPLRPTDYGIARHGVKEAYVKAWESAMASNTLVLNVKMLADGNIAFAQGNSWRGGDYCGPAIVAEIRRRAIEDPTYSYDPALEQYHEDGHKDRPRLTRPEFEQLLDLPHPGPEVIHEGTCEKCVPNVAVNA